ncbi:MAG: GAF and ANTAR domain-containing protein [Nakamurella sp.]
MGTRESEIIAAFTGLADRLVDDYDVVDLTTQLAEDCARLMDVAAVGLLLADATGVLHLLAATSEEARKLEAFQLQRDEGPCLDCYHSGARVSVADLRTEKARWPRFAASAAQEGFASVHAIPMRLRHARLGALGLFGTEPGTLGDDDLQLARGLAHVASIAIVQNNLTLEQGSVLGALQSAVASRGVVEMAKGVLSEAQSVDMQEAFNRLRGYARNHQQHLTDVAREIVSRRLPADELLSESASHPNAT